MKTLIVLALSLFALLAVVSDGIAQCGGRGGIFARHRGRASCQQEAVQVTVVERTVIRRSVFRGRGSCGAATVQGCQTPNQQAPYQAKSEQIAPPKK
jgi:hypothetical protein